MSYKSIGPIEYFKENKIVFYGGKESNSDMFVFLKRSWLDNLIDGYTGRAATSTSTHYVGPVRGGH